MVVEAQPGDQAMQRQLAEMEREYRRALAEGHISSLEAELAAL